MEAAEENAQVLTFTEDEHKSLVDYLNFISENARFDDVDVRGIHNFAACHIKVINLSKKIEGHIFEFKRMLKSQPKDES